MSTASPEQETPWRAVVRDYLELAKSETSLVVALSALAGFLLGSPKGVAGCVSAGPLVSGDGRRFLPLALDAGRVFKASVCYIPLLVVIVADRLV